jgi:hypothetical protein
MNRDWPWGPEFGNNLHDLVFNAQGAKHPEASVTIARQEAWRFAGRALGEAAAALQGLMDAQAGSGYRMKYIPDFIDSIIRTSAEAVWQCGGYVERARGMVELGHDHENGKITLWARLNEFQGKSVTVSAPWGNNGPGESL